MKVEGTGRVMAGDCQLFHTPEDLDMPGFNGWTVGRGSGATEVGGIATGGEYEFPAMVRPCGGISRCQVVCNPKRELPI